MMPKCSYELCEREAQFEMYRTIPKKKKRWLPVCDRHERFVARENMALAREREAKNAHN